MANKVKDGKPPAFLLYAADFMEDVADWSMTELGAYFRLLCNQWINGSIPVESARLSRMCRMEQSDFAPVWLVIREKFTVCDDGKLRNPRLERERQKQIVNRELRADQGRMGAEARWRNDGKTNAVAITQPIANDMAKHGLSFSSSVSNSISNTTSKPKTTTPLPASKGTSIPTDFKVTESHRQFALKQGFPNPDDHIEQFRDYWESRAGPGRLKRDWDATFRNWLREAAQRRGGRNGNSGNKSAAERRQELEHGAIKNWLGRQDQPSGSGEHGSTEGVLLPRRTEPGDD